MENEIENMTGFELVDELETVTKCANAANLWDEKARHEFRQRGNALRDEIKRRTNGGYKSIHALYGWMLQNAKNEGL